MANKKKAGKGNGRKKAGKRGGGVKPATNTTQATFPRSKLISSSSTASTGRVKTKQAHTTHACSILDPFCVHAKGARRPDGMGSQSMPYQSRSVVSVTTNTFGAAKLVIAGGNGIFGTAQATVNAGAWDWPTTYTALPGSAYISANAKEVRLVSMGVRVMSLTSANASQGFVILGTVNNPPIQTPAITAQPATIVTYAEHSLRPLTSGFETVWISKPTGVGAHDFRVLTSVVGGMTDFEWSSLIIEVGQSAVSTPVLMLEIICNVEFTISTDNTASYGLAQLIPPSKPANPVALQAQAQVHSRVSSIMDTTVEKAGKFIESKAGSVVEDILSGAMAFLGL